MSELLDPSGPWSSELIALMLPVAITLEAEKAEIAYGTTTAAISTLVGDKGSKAFSEGIESIKAAAMNKAREARGLPPVGGTPKPGETEADKFMRIFQSMKLRKSKGAPPPPPPPQTKVHRRGKNGRL